MCENNNETCSGCAIERFSFLQKLIIRVSLYGFVAVGALAIFLETVVGGIAYCAFGMLAGVLILRCFCSHCPYPYKHSTCLGLPYPVVKLFRHRDCRPAKWEVAVFVLVLILAIGIPQYWLWMRLPLFIAFWIPCLFTCFAFPVYFCPRCRYVNCPFHPTRLKILTVFSKKQNRP